MTTNLTRPPILVGDLELTEPINDLRLPAREDGAAYNGVRLLVRLQRMPIGYVSLSPNALDAASVAREIWWQLSSAINARRQRHGLEAIDTLPADGISTDRRLLDEIAERPLVSVVICTRDRPDSVMIALRRLAALRYGPLEIVVVDNAPSSDMTRDAVLAEFSGDPRFRYLREPKPGLSCARNRGIAEASAEIIAFTDDDVRVDQWWLDGIVRGFRRTKDVACVTGLVTTAALDNAVQLYFEKRRGDGFFRERVFDLTENRDDSPLYPYSVGVFGGGANFAMTRSVLKELGGFDEALGAGTPCGGGEDLDVFVRTVLAGHRLVYEPSAIVSHFHRAELSDLSRQMRAWGSGYTAVLTALVLRDRKWRLDLLRRVPIGVIRLCSIGDRTRDDLTLPSGMIAREFGGMVRGPWLYLKARRDRRRLIDHPAFASTRT
jgi:GT2 family glycosyltransferase